ncbi:MAG: ATP-binding protein [Dorea sp.]|nr:ATP-binding protein [Dorea sp.]MDY2813025.1 HAMP domain-containing sensor histidine kinase [Dorea sp.]
MRSTLYPKFILVYLVFGFLSIFTVATLTDNLIRSPLETQTASDMYREATLVANDYLPRYFSGDITSGDIRLQLSGIETQLNAAVWFVDKDGQIISSAQSEGYPIAPSQVKDFDPAESGSAKSQTGDYHGYFDEEVITVTAPVVYGYSPKGYLIIHKYVSDLNSLRDIMIHAAFITLVIVYALSFIILLAFHFFVYRPLHIITEAATQYATGNLDYEIPVKTEDEMGYLSASLNYMSSQLKDMEDYQKKFVANVSHDFRSPLTSIKGYVEAMADGTIPPELHEKYLNIILFETERLTDLTHDLLTLNEFDTKNLLLNKKAFDIHEVIKQVAASFEGVCTQKKISIELIFATKRLHVMADQRKIEQVLYNLLDNAIKFSDTNSIITIETTERGEKVYTSVKDNGIGIPRNALNKIWERFYKTDLSRGKDKKGTGLGLSIVKEIIQAHGENINVVSTEGVGTEFIFSLPKTS